jgi:hypothetical protein
MLNSFLWIWMFLICTVCNPLNATILFKSHTSNEHLHEFCWPVGHTFLICSETEALKQQLHQKICGIFQASCIYVNWSSSPCWLTWTNTPEQLHCTTFP